MIEPIISLAFSMQSHRGVYAMLLGSGISRAAGIPTGWEVMEDLISRVAQLYGESCNPDPETWFRNKFNEEPRYSKLLDALAKTPAERNGILKDYFEANEEEREQGKKLPTAAHHAIAGLVASGHIRVIVTTNFDRLMERALEAIGINPSVIDSPDKIKGAMPFIHAPCTIIKLHGDYMDIRIKNTPEELAKYDKRMNKALGQVLDEYGLIVCGWSADYDVALEVAIARCPSRRFTTYWAHVGKVGDAAKRLIDLRRAETIEIEGADSFFQELAEKVSALEEFDRPHPMSVKMAVATEKKYLEEEKYRIRLHDLVMGETNKLLEAIADKNFSTNIRLSTEEMQKRIASYESLSEILLGLLITSSYWSEAHQGLWSKALERIANPSENYTGSMDWERLRWYPAFLLMYGGGIASIASDKYTNLAALLAEPKVRVINKTNKEPAAVAITVDRIFKDSLHFFPNSEHDKLAVSRHLFKVLRQPLSEIIPIEDDYERFFITFEYLFTLIHADLQAKENISTYFWGSMGLFISEQQRRGGNVLVKAVKQQAQELGNNWPPLKAGLFEGSYERFENVVDGFEENLALHNIRLS
jgi:hypothetical protein